MKVHDSHEPGGIIGCSADIFAGGNSLLRLAEIIPGLLKIPEQPILNYFIRNSHWSALGRVSLPANRVLSAAQRELRPPG